MNITCLGRKVNMYFGDGDALLFLSVSILDYINYQIYNHWY